MLHLRLIVPSDLSDNVLRILNDAPEVTNVWTLAGAASKPRGDLVSCDVAKEEGSSILRELRAIGLEERGSIAVEVVDASVSRGATAAELIARGSPADAIVWEEIEGRVSESASLSVSYLVFMTIATMIGAIGLITDSIVLIIGAMVVGPEYGPLAGICVALIEGRPQLAAKSLRALAVGFPVAMSAAWLLTLALKATGIAPEALSPADHELTLFVVRPNWYSAIVAVLAGVAGMLALVSAKAGPLIGVLISVTTIPAAANVGVAIAYSNEGDAARGAAQLAINLAAIIVSGLIVLWLASRGRRRRTDDRTEAGRATN